LGRELAATTATYSLLGSPFGSGSDLRRRDAAADSWKAPAGGLVLPLPELGLQTSALAGPFQPSKSLLVLGIQAQGVGEGGFGLIVLLQSHIFFALLHDTSVLLSSAGGALAVADDRQADR
jgi:hypothetical protein